VFRAGASEVDRGQPAGRRRFGRPRLGPSGPAVSPQPAGAARSPRPALGVLAAGARAAVRSTAPPESTADPIPQIGSGPTRLEGLGVAREKACSAGAPASWRPRFPSPREVRTRRGLRRDPGRPAPVQENRPGQCLGSRRKGREAAKPSPDPRRAVPTLHGPGRSPRRDPHTASLRDRRASRPAPALEPRRDDSGPWHGARGRRTESACR